VAGMTATTCAPRGDTEQPPALLALGLVAGTRPGPCPALRPARSVRLAWSACPAGHDASLADGVYSGLPKFARR
jgi:hypothetical protein